MVRFDRVVVLILAGFLSASCDLLSSRPSSRSDGAAQGGAASTAAGEPGSGRPAPAVLPEGTSVPVALETSLSSATSKADDLVVARVTAW